MADRSPADDVGWEARMAERARARRTAREAEAQQRHQEAIAQTRTALEAVRPGTDWLNGYPLFDNLTTHIGNGVYCVGCGAVLGCFSIIIDESDVFPPQPPDPDWPFPSDGCPCCKQRREAPSWEFGRPPSVWEEHR